MKPRFLIFISIIVLLIAALLFWRHSIQPPASVKQPTAAVRPTNAPIIGTNGGTPTAAQASVPQPPKSSPEISPLTNRLITPEKWREYIESHNLPVDFYGLVIDQNSNPIPGVKIKSGVRHWTMPAPEVGSAGTTTIPLEAITGADGRFELTGASGDGFGVLLFKDGYEAESEKNGYGAGSYSYANPVIFKMWSTNIHEQLITGNRSFDIVPDGRPYLIDLTAGIISETGTGDLKVWVKRPEQITFGQRYDWSSEVDVINGGLQAASGDAMWMAPSNGYVPSFQFEQTVGSGWGDSTGERQFYIRLNNGKEYGRISIELEAYYNSQIPAMIRLSYAINPSGSRILR